MQSIRSRWILRIWRSGRICSESSTRWRSTTDRRSYPFGSSSFVSSTFARNDDDGNHSALIEGKLNDGLTSSHVPIHKPGPFNDDVTNFLFEDDLTELNSCFDISSSGGDEIDYDVKLSTVDVVNAFDSRNPPPVDRPMELQVWLECEAHQESIRKYEEIIERARNRKDYSSLSLVQRQILWWFQPLCDAIEERQKEYIFRSSDEPTPKGAKKVGPFLCLLPPAKLAVVAAHAAILEALMQKSGSLPGVPFAKMAARIGQAVEDEVAIQRVLFKKYREAQARAKTLAVEDILENEPTLEEAEPTVSLEDSSDPDQAPQPSHSQADTHEAANSLSKWSYTSSHLDSYLDEIKTNKPKNMRLSSFAVWRAKQLLDMEDSWTEREKIHLGSSLFEILLGCAMVKNSGQQREAAFIHRKEWVNGKSHAYVELNKKLTDMIVSDKLQTFTPRTSRQKPMIIPPKPWSTPDEGGYLWLKTDVVRYHDCEMQKEALGHADLSTAYEGLNALARVPWRINKRILKVAQTCWDNNIAIGDIPSRDDYNVPPEPIKPESPPVLLEKGQPGHDEYVRALKVFYESKHKYNRMRQRNADLVSLRCSALLKLEQAEKFKEFEQIYFPYSMDFRGRAYPCTPHLSIVGSDLCRGLLRFSEAKPLGRNGLFWLKVHLANLGGYDKATFEERAQYVDNNMDKVRESASDPFAGERWWTTLDDPFQGLAVCDELIAAIDSGDPEKHMCSLAVHMDGSCNGLQHYAALGRDSHGGMAVNLRNVGKPQDVYSGVMKEVIRRIAEEALQTPEFDTSDVENLSKKNQRALADNRAAKLVNGLIDRGVVKRTVMTSVYGVTYVGAREQIQEKIEEKLEAQGHDLDEISNEVFSACGYLARVTMEVMGQVFTGAKETMNWLTTCARLITQNGYPVAWVSPIGIPAIQPYRQKKSSNIVTLMQVVTVMERNDDLPLHKTRQVSAFPPNFVHSLDASHMLLTALEMDRRSLTFSAVHDSFWTHPCDIDEMNDALRDVFVDLYSQPILEQQLEDWKLRYPDLEFPPLPERGNLDLNEVKSAKYFFQ